ncbi:unnamed protein product [Schistocephalus solidus]|uniref:C2H2-type domain-containing protein n=1 Tax=Schistocephalus solidus TaxID=70667 RepID=A0A183T253_SCHSO|nr:unnamed protein product [Schistocephalus solidus]
MIYRVPKLASGNGAEERSRRKTSESEGSTEESANDDFSVKRNPFLLARTSLATSAAGKPKLSYEVASDSEPFEEIIIRAETFFPELKNIVESSANLFENSFKNPIAPGVPKSPLEDRNPHLPRTASLFANNQFRRQKNLRQQGLLSPGCAMHPCSSLQHQHPQSHPNQIMMQYSGYYPPGPQHPPPLEPPGRGPEVERTTYDRRNFQAALQHFEQRSLASQPPLKPTSFFMSPELRFMDSKLSPPPPPPPLPPSSLPQPSKPSASVSQTVMKKVPGFLTGCNCGPGSGCGALTSEAMVRRSDNMTDVETIQQYLVAEEPGPGGVKKVFSFPMGAEPGDLTLLRAAVSANRPKDAYIPEENDDIETQLDQQLQAVRPDMPATRSSAGAGWATTSNFANGQNATPVPAHTASHLFTTAYPIRNKDRARDTDGQITGIESALSALMYNGVERPADDFSPHQRPQVYNTQQTDYPQSGWNAVGVAGSRQPTDSWTQNFDPRTFTHTTYSTSRFNPLNGADIMSPPSGRWY